MNMIYVYLHVSLFNNGPSPATHLSKSLFVNLAPLRNPGIHASEEFLRMVWRVWLSVGGGDPMVRHCRSRSLRLITRNPSDIPMTTTRSFLHLGNFPKSDVVSCIPVVVAHDKSSSRASRGRGQKFQG